MNSVKIKSIKKLNPSNYEYKYSVNVEDNHNYYLNDGILSKNCVIIIDETQNINLHTFKTIITRIGRNSKMIFLGDVEQIDRKNVNESCLATVYAGFKDADFIGTVEFNNRDCVRNKLIPKVLDILNKL